MTLASEETQQRSWISSSSRQGKKLNLLHSELGGGILFSSSIPCRCVKSGNGFQFGWSFSCITPKWPFLTLFVNMGKEEAKKSARFDDSTINFGNVDSNTKPSFSSDQKNVVKHSVVFDFIVKVWIGWLDRTGVIKTKKLFFHSAVNFFQPL